jgi:hypothetical protein
MTPLQILRQTLKDDGATITMRYDDGYRIVIDGADRSGQPVRWEVAEHRLEQAIQRILQGQPDEDGAEKATS